MTAPHKEFPRENCTTLQAGIRILSPVNELRPGQALCSRTQKDPHARPREYFPSRHTILQNILESTHGFRDIHDAQPARGGYRFYQLLLVHGSVFISCFFAQAKIAFSDRKGTGKALSRLSPPKTCRACASSYTTRLPGSTPSGLFARPSRGRRSCYMLISSAPPSVHSSTVTVNVIGLPRISSPGLNGSFGSVGVGFSGSTLPAPSEKSSV